MCFIVQLHRVTQNHRTIGAGRDLQRSSSPTPCRSRLTRALAALGLWYLVVLQENKPLKIQCLPRVTFAGTVSVSKRCLPPAFWQLLRSTLIFQAALIPMTWMRFFYSGVTMACRCCVRPSLQPDLGWQPEALSAPLSNALSVVVLKARVKHSILWACSEDAILKTLLALREKMLKRSLKRLSSKTKQHCYTKWKLPSLRQIA